MARRRMFSVELIDSDRFMDLSAQTQMLYMYLCIHADDEGFVSSGRRMARLYGGVEQLDLLEEQSFIIRFDSGVLVITDWYLNNTVRKDRSVQTVFRQERSRLLLQDGRYVLQQEQNLQTDGRSEAMKTAWKPEDNQLTTDCQPNDNQLTTNCQPSDNHLATQNRIEQNRKEYMIIDHNRTESSSCDGSFAATEDGDLGNDSYIEKKYPSCSEIYLYCQDAGLEAVSPVNFWSYYYQNGWRDKNGDPVKDWKSLLHHWDAYAQQKGDSS